MNAVNNLDEHDRSLIRALQEDARASYQDLATRTGMSPATVRRRVERLFACNVVRPMTVPGWPELGYTMIAFVGISVELTRLKEVSAKLASMDEFYWLAMTTGDYDLLGQIVLSTNNDVAEFVSERVAPIEGIRNFRILVAPTFYKPSWDYRLPEPPASD